MVACSRVQPRLLMVKARLTRSANPAGSGKDDRERRGGSEKTSRNFNELTPPRCGTRLAWSSSGCAARFGRGAFSNGERAMKIISGLAALAFMALAAQAQAASRIKDLANVEGVRQNQLIGYGLVVGLNGTGDTINNIPFTKQSLTAMLERLGVNIRGATIRTGNVAAVMVTGNLPAFGTQGTRMDVTVSALGDAKNLTGGTLLVTPLLGADGNVYAVAQGSVAISGFQAEEIGRASC